jgi:hypothetical protein
MRGLSPRGRHNHAVGINHVQAAEPLRGGQGRQRDARPRPHRGRRRAGARLAQEPGHGAREDPRAPERAQQLIGEDVIHLAAVDQLRAIGNVAPDLLDAVIAYLDDGNAWAAERLTREPGWVLDAALTHSGDGKVFAAYLHSASSREIADLRLGKKTEQLYEQAEKLHRQLDRYAYGPPQVRFSDADVDQARAAGVLIEFDGPGQPIIVDRPLYRELVKTSIKRTHDELEARAAAAAKERKTTRAAKQPVDPVAVAKRERDAQRRG